MKIFYNRDFGFDRLFLDPRLRGDDTEDSFIRYFPVSVIPAQAGIQF
jgi:hypothetical protein